MIAGVLERPSGAGVRSFVDARRVGFANGHSVGGTGVDGLEAAKVEFVGIGDVKPLPGGAVVGGAKD